MSEERVVREKEGKEKQEKELTKKQLALLKLVYRFRFVTSKHVAAYFKQTQLRTSQLQLNDLNARGYLIKRHESSYRIQGRSAEYFLTPKAIPILRNLLTRPSERELKQTYARPIASRHFINRSLDLFDIYLSLNRLYNDKLNFVTKPQLNVEVYDYLPSPLPDVFFTLGAKTKSKRNFFLEYFDDNVSIGIHGRKINGYMEYEESGEWDDTGLEFPTVVIICQSETMFRRAGKRVRYINREAYSDMQFRLITLDKLKKLSSIKEQVWFDPIEKANCCLV